jgi:hypothetical protein
MEVKNSVHGKGLFATTAYKIGDIVHILNGTVYNSPTRETIHIGNGIHIYDAYGIYMNHSPRPNIRVDGTHLVAIRQIYAGDELVFNYNETEVNMACPFYDEIGNYVCGFKAK